MPRKAGSLRFSSPPVSKPASRRHRGQPRSPRLGALFRVTLPLAMPGVVTALIFTFIAAWNEFISALASVATIPVFILFTLIEGRVVGGLTAGSVK